MPTPKSKPQRKKTEEQEMVMVPKAALEILFDSTQLYSSECACPVGFPCGYCNKRGKALEQIKRAIQAQERGEK